MPQWRQHNAPLLKNRCSSLTSSISRWMEWMRYECADIWFIVAMMLWCTVLSRTGNIMWHYNVACTGHVDCGLVFGLALRPCDLLWIYYVTEVTVARLSQLATGQTGEMFACWWRCRWAQLLIGHVHLSSSRNGSLEKREVGLFDTF